MHIKTERTNEISAENYVKNASFVPRYGESLLEMLGECRGRRILDLGCGDGQLTQKLADMGARVVGVDISSALAAKAQALGLDVRVMDAQTLDFHQEFDVAFSNAALHWMPETDRVLAGVYRALVPGGQFLGEFGGHGNVAAICTAVRAVLQRHFPTHAQDFSWYFPTAEAFSHRLEQAGFHVDFARLHPRPTPLPTGMKGWLATFVTPFLAGIEESAHPALLDEMIALLADSLQDEHGQWTADYVRLRFSCFRPAG